MSFVIVSENESDMFAQSPHCEARTAATDHAELMEELSSFGDDACGEPAFPQHLVLDFTPDPEVDNEIVQKKICDFWAFINSVPEIHNLMVKPERDDDAPKPTTIEVVKSEIKAVDVSASAFSMLESIEQKGLINRTFEAKLPQTYCSLDSHASEDSDNIQQKETRKHVSIQSKRPVMRKPCLVKKLPSLKAKIMCKKLEEWDKKNPKSMEPPGHPPALHHCIIQGEVFKS